MAKPESYPFLRIARQYDVDYGDVLMLAQSYTTGSFAVRSCFPFASKVDNAVAEAVNIQEQVRAGRFQWPSLEPVQ